MRSQVLTVRRGIILLVGAIALLWLGVALNFGTSSSKLIDITGDWGGVLASRPLIAHISRDSAGYLNIALDPNASGLTAANAALDGDTFRFEIPVVLGAYSGTVSSDGKTISGSLTESGISQPLNLIRRSARPMPRESKGTDISASPSPVE